MNTMTQERIAEPRTGHPRLPRFGRLRKLALETFETARFVTEALQKAAEQRRRRRAVLRQRRMLARLDERTLKDIGLHRAELDSIAAELEGEAPVTRRHAHRDSVAPLY